MSDTEPVSPKPSSIIDFLDRIGLSQNRRIALAKFFGWFKQPSNLLSVVAILAVVIVPMIIMTVTRAIRRDFIRHKRIARWTFPFWLYVSITGVVIYVMLYVLYPRHMP